MAVDHFPSTHATWLDAQLTIMETAGDGSPAGRGALDGLRRHLMERYHAALTLYVRGSSLRRLGEPDDIVGGFFAERVCKPGFLPQWRSSGLPLRRWMMTGINLYGKSLVRERTRDRLRAVGGAFEHGDELGDADGAEGVLGAIASDEASAERAFERAWALAVLNAALAQVHAELLAQGRLDEYAIFRRRVVEGETYETIAPSVGRTPQQCAGATRLVTDRLREALRSALREDGVGTAELEQAVAEVFAAFGMGLRRD